jgi:hypothetical protein
MLGSLAPIVLLGIAALGAVILMVAALGMKGRSRPMQLSTAADRAPARASESRRSQFGTGSGRNPATSLAAPIAPIAADDSRAMRAAKGSVPPPVQAIATPTPAKTKRSRRPSGIRPSHSRR